MGDLERPPKLGPVQEGLLLLRAALTCIVAEVGLILRKADEVVEMPFGESEDWLNRADPDFWFRAERITALTLSRLLVGPENNVFDLLSDRSFTEWILQKCTEEGLAPLPDLDVYLGTEDFWNPLEKSLLFHLEEILSATMKEFRRRLVCNPEKRPMTEFYFAEISNCEFLSKALKSWLQS